MEVFTDGQLSGGSSQSLREGCVRATLEALASGRSLERVVRSYRLDAVMHMDVDAIIGILVRRATNLARSQLNVLPKEQWYRELAGY